MSLFPEQPGQDDSQNPYGFSKSLQSLINVNKRHFNIEEQRELEGIIKGYIDDHAKGLMAIGAGVDLLEERCQTGEGTAEKKAYYAQASIKYPTAMKARRTYLCFKDALDEYDLYGPTKASILSKFRSPEKRKEVWDKARGTKDKPTTAMLEEAIRSKRKSTSDSADSEVEIHRLDAITETTPLGNGCELYVGDGKVGLLILRQSKLETELRKLAKVASSCSGKRVVFEPAPKV